MHLDVGSNGHMVSLLHFIFYDYLSRSSTSFTLKGDNDLAGNDLDHISVGAVANLYQPLTPCSTFIIVTLIESTHFGSMFIRRTGLAMGRTLTRKMVRRRTLVRMFHNMDAS